MKRLLPAVLLVLATSAAAAPPTRFTAGPIARVPFQVRSHHVVARGAVNGDSAWIVIDSGAAGSVMDSDLANRLGLHAVGEAEALGAGGAVNTYQYGDVTVGLPGLEIHQDEMTALPLADLAVRGGHPMDLILGYELFENNVVVFDYAAGVMEVYDRSRALPPSRGVEVPLTFAENHPYVEGEITLPGGKKLAGRFVIDSGSSMALMVSASGESRDRVIATFPRTLDSFGRGVGGELHNAVGRAESFRLGTLTIDRPIVVVPALTGGRISAPGTIGNIGGQILSRFRVTFDYVKGVVRFEPNARSREPYETDMSGAAITMETGGFTVRRVANDSPAAEVGLLEGDVVLSVDGRAASTLSLPDVRELLKGEGRSVKLEVSRDGETHELEMKLRRLL
jgi:hypothetical protein